MLLHSKGLPAVPALGLQKRPHCYNKTSSLWEHRAMVLPPGGIAQHLAPTERSSVFCLVCCGFGGCHQVIEMSSIPVGIDGSNDIQIAYLLHFCTPWWQI